MPPLDNIEKKAIEQVIEAVELIRKAHGSACIGDYIGEDVDARLRSARKLLGLWYSEGGEDDESETG